MYAIDKGVPPLRTGPKVVEVQVIRNRNSPEFLDEPYSKELRQDADPGTEVLSVRSTDRDERDPFNKLSYEIIGDDAAPGFFRIDATNGRITVSNNLENDGTREYKVSLIFSTYHEHKIKTNTCA